MVEMLREHVELAADAQADAASSAATSSEDGEGLDAARANTDDNRDESAEAALVEDMAARIITGTAVSERKSTFQVRPNYNTHASRLALRQRRALS